MLVHNLTPFPFGYIACSRRPPQPEMTFVVRGKFRLRPGEPVAPVGMDAYLPEYLTDEERRAMGSDLDRVAQGSLTAEMYADDDPERTGEPQYPGDFAEFKPNAEVMLRGCCYPPGGSATQCYVRMRVGEWVKELNVVGPRAWVDKIVGGKMTEPMAFSKMPLDYAHALGGAEHPLNPVGMGHSGHNAQRVPCVEPIKKRGELAEPASFAPLNPAWPQRTSKLGTKYDAEYQKTRAPYYAEDFDWSYFNSAPASQRLNGYLRGDEELVCDHMHPTAARNKAPLPGVRIRVFLRDKEGNTRPITMVLDTLYVDMEKEELYLTWRGLITVKEVDFSDQEAALVIAEMLADQPRPDAEYIEMLAKMVADPMGLKAVYGEDPEALLDVADEAPDYADMVAEQGPGVIDKLIEDKLGFAGEAGKGVGTLVKRMFGNIPPERMKDAISGRSKRPADVLEKLETDLKKTRTMLDGEGADTSQFDVIEARLDNAKERLSEYGGVKGPDEPAPGANCTAQDLSGRDLSGMDLRGVCFAHANLSKAKLRGANLAGADLSRAVLFRTDLCDANLSGAKLEFTDMTLAVAIKTVFDGASCNHTIFRRTVLDQASFKEAKGEFTDFSKAEMAGIDATKSCFSQANFIKCKLDGASFPQAQLLRCAVRQCQATGLSLAGATVDGTSFDDSKLLQSDFSRMAAESSIWRKAQLDGSNLSFSTLPGALFQDASAAGVSFDAAMMRGVRFYRANLRRCRWHKADLLGADFRYASIDKGLFVGANLYDAKFIEAAGVDVDFSDAILKKANFERCKVVRA